MTTTGTFKVGELAQASGLSIRTVRYYDQIGLLSPSQRSEGGHRVYDDADARRLYRICLLRYVGLSLADIASALDEPDWNLHHAMLHHLELLDHKIGISSSLRRRLSQMLTAIAHEKPPDGSNTTNTATAFTARYRLETARSGCTGSRPNWGWHRPKRSARPPARLR